MAGLGARRLRPRLAPNVLAEVGLADRYARFDSPIGPLVVAWNGLGVSAVEAADDDATFEADHLARTGRPAHPRRASCPTAWPRRSPAGSTATGGSGSTSTCAATPTSSATSGSKALEIPRGEVRPYGWIAAEIGRPKAVRAVGTALGHNPVPLIVPCHRVVRSDGTIGQYSLGGPGEQADDPGGRGPRPAEMEQLAASGVRFIGSDTTKIFCLPTCRHARRVTDRHRLEFHSMADGQARGYRACLVCRPASAAIAA